LCSSAHEVQEGHNKIKKLSLLSAGKNLRKGVRGVGNLHETFNYRGRRASLEKRRPTQIKRAHTVVSQKWGEESGRKWQKIRRSSKQGETTAKRTGGGGDPSSTEKYWLEIFGGSHSEENDGALRNGQVSESATSLNMESEILQGSCSVAKLKRPLAMKTNLKLPVFVLLSIDWNFLEVKERPLELGKES